MKTVASTPPPHGIKLAIWNGTFENISLIVENDDF